MFPCVFHLFSPTRFVFFRHETPAELEKSAALQVAALMAAAARTAPKTCGIDNIKTAAIDDEPTKQKVIAKMREIATKESRPGLARDAGNIENSPALVVIGVESNAAGLNCGFCGKRPVKRWRWPAGPAHSTRLTSASPPCRRRKWPAGSTLTTASCIHRPGVPGFGNVRAEGQTGARHSIERDRQKSILRPQGVIRLALRRPHRRISGSKICPGQCAATGPKNLSPWFHHSGERSHHGPTGTFHPG